MELHLNTYGSFIRKKDEMFEIQVDESKHKISPDKVSSILISNAATITSDAIQLAMEKNIDVVFLDKYGDPYGRIWYPKIGSTVLIRRRQLELFNDDLGLQFIRYRVILKIMRQYRFIGKLLSKRDKPIDSYATQLSQIHASALAINNLDGTLEDLIPSIMGLEGTASKLYFRILADLLPKEYSFEGRSSRPARDAFNAMLNYGYGILYSKVERALIIAGMDPYIGLMHADNYNKKSFVYDFIEPYRIFIDEPVFYIFSRRKFQKEFIQDIHKGVLLSTAGKKFLAPLLLEHFDELVRHHNKNRKRIATIQADAHAFANFMIEKRTSYLDKSDETQLTNFLNTNGSLEEGD